MQTQPTILIVDNNDASLTEMAEKLKIWGYRTLSFRFPAEVFPVLDQFPVTAAIVNVDLPEMDGLTLCRKLRQRLAYLVCILLADRTDMAIMKRAINDLQPDAFFERPLPDDELRQSLRAALENRAAHVQQQQQLKELDERATALSQQTKELALQNIELIRLIQRQSERYVDLVGGSAQSTQQLFEKLDAISKLDDTLLIVGEPGTGKELIGRALHHNSLRQRQPFLTINCAHVPTGALARELFGPVSDEADAKRGLLELAHRGTLLIKNIEHMPLDLQNRLTQVLQTRRLYRDQQPIEVNVRLIATTCRNLGSMAEAGEFSTPLFQLLTALSVQVPPLRERIEDLPFLVKFFIQTYNQKYEKIIAGAEPGLITHWQHQPWPGNIRELENLIQQMCLFSSGDRLRVADLPTPFQRPLDPEQINPDDLDSFVTLDALERDYIQKVLQACGGNRSKAARILGMKRTTLLFRMEKLGIS